jgi:hypothetical protein
MATRPGPPPDSVAQRDARVACVKTAGRCMERWAKANTDVVRALAGVSNTVLQRPCVTGVFAGPPGAAGLAPACAS